MPDGQEKIGHQHGPPLVRTSAFWPFSEMMGVQVTANCSHAPLNQKSKPMQAPCEPTTRISHGSWANDGGWEITAQAGQTRQAIRQRARISRLLSRSWASPGAVIWAKASRTAQAVIGRDW